MATEEPSNARTKIFRRPPGRLTKKQVEIALRNAAGIQAIAAEKLQVSRATVCRMVAKHHTLQVLIVEITEEMTDLSEGHLLKAMRDGKDWAVKYWLENRGQSRGYGIRKLAFRDGEGNMAVPAILVTNGRMSADDFEAKYGTAPVAAD